MWINRNFSNNKNLNGKVLSNDSIEECYYNDDYTLCKEKDIECLTPYPFNYCSTIDTETSVEKDTVLNNNNNNIQTEIIKSEPISTSISLPGIIDIQSATTVLKVNTPSTTTLLKIMTLSTTKVKTTYITLQKTSTTITLPETSTKITIPKTSTTIAIPKTSTTLTLSNDNVSKTSQIVKSKTTTMVTKRKVAAASRTIRKINIISTTIKKITIISTTIQRVTAIPTTMPNDNNSLPISLNGRCGSDQGQCPSGECCSKYGWCGTSKEHCNISEGCQSEFSKCNQDVEEVKEVGNADIEEEEVEDVGNINDEDDKDDIEYVENVEYRVSTNNKCNEKDGSCPSGECCSKYGWCGSSEEHCDISKGCQPEFGKCNQDVNNQVSVNQDVNDQVSVNQDVNDQVSVNQDVKYQVSVNGRCSEKDGSCPSGECCSKYGWCGSSEDHCNNSKGCQSKFGVCSGEASINNKTSSTKTKSILKLESISEPQLESTSESSNHGKCGEGFGKCSDGQCCSKYGWCGKSDEYCSLDQGCQSQFGECY